MKDAIGGPFVVATIAVSAGGGLRDFEASRWLCSVACLPRGRTVYRMFREQEKTQGREAKGKV